MQRSASRARSRSLSIAAVLVLAAAACGGDDDAPAATDPPATTAAPADDTDDTGDADDDGDDGAGGDVTPSSERANEPGAACIGSGDGSGEPIIIGSIQTDESPVAGFAEITEGADACFRAINETGGIDGRPIDFRRCNDSADPVQGESCARDLIDAGAIAVLGGICFSCFSAPVVDVLGAGGVPYVGGLPVLPPEFEQENFLAITNAGGSASLYANAAYIMNAAAEMGVEANVVEINASVGEINTTLEDQIIALGGNYVGRVNFDPASADLSSVAQQAIDQDPNFVSVQTDGPNTVSIVTSLRTQGYEGEIVILATAADPQSIEGMGAASEGVYVAAFFDNLGTGSSPDALKFQADMRAAGHDPELTLSITGYAGAFVTAEALFAIDGEITRDSFRASLLEIDGLAPLFGGEISYRNATADFPRTFYFIAYGNVIRDGEVVGTGSVFNFATGEPVG